MTRTQFEKMPLKELLQLKRRVDDAVAKAHEKERLALMEKVEKMAREAGFTLEELVGRDRGRPCPNPLADDAARHQPQTDWPSLELSDEERLENGLIG